MERSEKQTQIGEIKERFDRTTAAVFLDFTGMKVATATRLRAEFRKAGVEYRVVKNTLVKHALKDASYAGELDKVLVGATGVAWSYEDPGAAAKVVKAFKIGPGQTLTVKAGLIVTGKGASGQGEGQVLDAKGVADRLATLPGKDELRAKLLATLQAPLQSFVALLQAPGQNFVYALSARKDQQ